jgi:hypothetical protein
VYPLQPFGSVHYQGHSYFSVAEEYNPTENSQNQDNQSFYGIGTSERTKNRFTSTLDNQNNNCLNPVKKTKNVKSYWHSETESRKRQEATP